MECIKPYVHNGMTGLLKTIRQVNDTKYKPGNINSIWFALYFYSSYDVIININQPRHICIVLGCGKNYKIKDDTLQTILGMGILCVLSPTGLSTHLPGGGHGG